MTPVVVVGAGGFGREVADYLVAAHGAGAVRGFIDDDPGRAADRRLRYPYLGDRGGVGAGDCAVIAVGDPAVRARLAKGVAAAGASLVSVVHPTAQVAASACLGLGCVIGPYCYVGPDAVLHDDVVLNVHCSVGHDVVVGDHAVLSPMAALSGHVELGPRCFLGTAAVVGVGHVIGEDSKVSAGAIVLQDVPARSLVAGNPAKGRVLFQAFNG